MLKKYYHGTSKDAATNILESGIDLSKGRPNTDFGQGFYMTENYAQAAKWADGAEESAVVAFYCDIDKLNGVCFSGFTKEWKDTVFSNRVRDLDVYANKDYVEGPLADGKTKRMATRVIAGRASKEDFMKEICKSDIGTQIAFKTAASVRALKRGHIVIKEGLDNEEHTN